MASQFDFHFRGHADFYPNGGLTPQPGCKSLDIITLASCSHYRAPVYFAESILLPESFPSYECDMIDLLPSPFSCLSTNYKNKNSPWVFMGEYLDPSYVEILLIKFFPFVIKKVCNLYFLQNSRHILLGNQ